MTRDETKKLFMILASAYPPNLRIESTAFSISLWYKLLQDIKYLNAEKGLIEYIKKNKYPPSVSDIRNMAMGIGYMIEVLEAEKQMFEATIDDQRLIESVHRV